MTIYATRSDLGTLPQEVRPGPYLRGIIRNQHFRLELERIEVHLLKQRLRVRDLSLEPLTRAADRLRSQVSEASSLVKAFLEQALKAPYRIDFLFWAKATTDAFLLLAGAHREGLYKTLVRRVTAASKAHQDRRFDLIDRLAACMALSPVAAAA